MASKIAIIIFLWAAAAHAVEIRTPEDADKFVEDVLKRGAADPSRDTATLEDIDEDIDKNDFLFSFHGSVKLSEGSVSGMNSASRYAESHVVVNADNTTSVTAYIEYRNLKVSYNRAEIEINQQALNGTYGGGLQKLRVQAELTADERTGAVTLDDVRFRSVQGSRLTIHGSGIFNFRNLVALRDVNSDIARIYVVSALADNLKSLVQEH